MRQHTWLCPATNRLCGLQNLLGGLAESCLTCKLAHIRPAFSLKLAAKAELLFSAVPVCLQLLAQMRGVELSVL